jgi:hypothetical protein
LRGADGTRFVELGRARTHGQLLPLGSDDPVIAARAVRRALAAGGHRASDVGRLVVASPDPIEPDALARFARRALGPHGATVGTVALVADAADAPGLASEATRAPGSVGDGALVVAVGLAADGEVVACCLRPARRPDVSAPDRPPGS